MQNETAGLVVTLTDASGNRGRGESCGVDYLGETLETMTRQLEQVRSVVETGALDAGLSREHLLQVLPDVGARFALDSALWDLDAKQTGITVFARCGIARPKPVNTAFTIGIRSPDQYTAAARARSDHALLKIKVDASASFIAAVSPPALSNLMLMRSRRPRARSRSTMELINSSAHSRIGQR
ncbi:MAG: hypothetical protein ABI885_09485 [Gammaproteobacteria bacterium]